MSAGSTYLRKARTLVESGEYDAEQVVDLLRKAEKAGNAEAIYALGTWHLFGKHLPKDLLLASRYFERAAELDHPDAAFDLAISHERGKGIPKDTSRAFSLYMKAALLGDRQAMYEVGRCFYWGIGTEKDRQAASVWFDAYERAETPRRTAAHARRSIRKAPRELA